MSIFLVIYIIGFGFSVIYYSIRYAEDYLFLSTSTRGLYAVLDGLIWPFTLVFYLIGKFGDWLYNLLSNV
jgi:hypothetical protein